MSGSDDGRGNSEEREGGPPARVLPGGQIVQPGQVDRLPNIEHDVESKDARWWAEIAEYWKGQADAKHQAIGALEIDVTDAREQLRGAVSSWPSARNVIEAVREGQLGLDALREVVTILDINLGAQS